MRSRAQLPRCRHQVLIDCQFNFLVVPGFLVSPRSSGRTHLRRVQNCQVDLQQHRLHPQSVYALRLL